MISGGWRIGRVAGIDIRIHPTFLVIVGLAVVGAFGPPLEGLAWISLLFGSVAVHELAHSMVARRRGLSVQGITLLPIGGVSQIDELAESHRSELAIAAAGPLTSLGIAASAALVSAAAGHPLLPIDLVQGSFVHRLAWANAFLAVFNLLPAFPLDGGRMYRAFLARRMGMERATLAAARLGTMAAVAMAVVGVLWDPWLILIAVFIHLGGKGEAAATVLHERLGSRRVGDAMLVSPDADAPLLAQVAPMVVHEEDSLEQAVQSMLEEHRELARVEDEAGQLVGVLRLPDVLGRPRDGPSPAGR